jgi:hypothetical protein
MGRRSVFLELDIALLQRSRRVSFHRVCAFALATGLRRQAITLATVGSTGLPLALDLPLTRRERRTGPDLSRLASAEGCRDESISRGPRVRAQRPEGNRK